VTPIRIMAAGLLVLGAAFATAQDAAPSAPASTPRGALAPAFEAAWQRAVAAREAEGGRRTAAAEQAAAGRWLAAPPVLELNHRDDRWSSNAGRRETELGVALPLWLPGQRAAHGAAADLGAARARASQELARWRVAGEVREAAWSLLALQADARLARAQGEGLQQLADDVERRVRAGDLARADALAARAEHLEAQAQQVEAEQALQAALGQWQVLTGLAEPPPAASLLVQPSEGVHAERPGAHPELQFAALTVDHARRRLELLRASRRDPPELAIGWRQDIGGRAERAQNSLALGLRLPLGAHERQAPQEAAAQAELAVAQTAEQRLRDRVVADEATARAAIAAAVRQQRAEADRAGLLRERAALLQRSFSAGETPLPELLRARALAARADAVVARQQIALGRAHARLQQALGELP
jgi:cobalt-zinc-cadmium efflux system outer membrane protein